MNFAKLMRSRRMGHSVVGLASVTCMLAATAIGCGEPAGTGPDAKMPTNTVTPAVEPPSTTVTGSPTSASDPAMNPSTTGGATGMGMGSGMAGTGTTGTGTTTDTGHATQTSTPAAPPLTDEQIAAITNVVNTSEVEEGKLATTKAKNADVKKFAQMMVQHHTEAKQQQSKLLTKLKVTPQESAMTAELKSEGDKNLASLKEKSGADFDRTYVDAQVKEHKEVLDTIDSKLLPAAKNPELKTLIQGLRPRIQQHLDQATKLQTTLGTSK